MVFKNLGLIIAFSIIILNPWWWRILQRNLIAGLLAFVLSLVFYIYFWQNKSKKLLFLIIILTLFLIVISFRQAFDESIFRNSALDIQQINKRHEFYAKDLGKLYTNRISLTYFKEYSLVLSRLQRNFFNNIDLNLYFFASHPRERLGVQEFEKILPVFLPFFLVGLLFVIYKKNAQVLIYIGIISFFNAFISPYYELGPILFFSVINFFIAIGFILVLRKRIKI